jgi:hypothetical protein
MRRSIFLFRMVICGAGICLATGCASHGAKKTKYPSYDRAITNSDNDPTFHSDPERADLEVHDAQ